MSSAKVWLLRFILGFTVFSLGYGFVTSRSFAASFDCARAKTNMEKLICGNDRLSKSDEELGASYSKALKEVSDPATLKKAQRKWLTRAQRCEEASCLETLLSSRIALLASGRNKQGVSEHILGVCDLVDYRIAQVQLFPDINARTYFADERDGVKYLAANFYPVQISVVQQPQHGTLEPDSRGDWSGSRYFPNDNYRGHDFFIMQVEDKGQRKLKIHYFIYVPDSYGVQYNPNPACEAYQGWKISANIHGSAQVVLNEL